MGHHSNMKIFCRICMSTNKLEKMTSNEELYFFVSEFDGNRICKTCRTTFEILMTTGKQFSKSLHNFKITGMDINLFTLIIANKMYHHKNNL